MTTHAPRRVFLSSFALAGGTVLTMLAMFLIADHATEVRRTRELLPVAQRLPILRDRLTVLRAQLEVADLQAAVRTTPAEEQLHEHVLPESSSLQSLLGAFEALQDQLSADGHITNMSTVQVGDPQSTDMPGLDGLSAIPLSVSFTGDAEGMRIVSLFVDMAGYLTVADALTPSELDRLLTTTEEENPTAVTALEQFLSTSLLSYCRTPERYEDQLAKSFSAPEFLHRLQTILGSSRLVQARYLLGGAFGLALEERGLWPLRLLTVDKSTIETLDDGSTRLSLRLMAYSRGQE